MKRFYAFASKHVTLITIVLMAVSIIAIIVAGGAPDCFRP